MTCFSRDVIKFSNQGLCLFLSLSPSLMNCTLKFHWVRHLKEWKMCEKKLIFNTTLGFIYSYIHTKHQQTHNIRTELLQSLFLIRQRPTSFRWSRSDWFGVDPSMFAIFIYALNEWEKCIRNALNEAGVKTMSHTEQGERTLAWWTKHPNTHTKGEKTWPLV